MNLRLPLLLLLLVLLSGCSTYQKFQRDEACEKTIKAYRNMVRWQELEKAVLGVVDAEQRASFAKSAEAFRRRGITVVDARELAVSCQTERGLAEATIEFDYFALPSSRVQTVTDRQKWIYRIADSSRPDLVEGWKLTTPLPEFR